MVGIAVAEAISNADRARSSRCDVLAPCALEGQITHENADRMKAKIVAEARRWPYHALGRRIIPVRTGIVLIPDVLSNGGGVTVSYFEWVQNRRSLFLD